MGTVNPRPGAPLLTTTTLLRHQRRHVPNGLTF